MRSRQAVPLTAEEAAALVRPGDWVDYGFGIGQPDAFDRALAARQEGLSRVKIRAAWSLRPLAAVESGPQAATSEVNEWILESTVGALCIAGDKTSAWRHGEAGREGKSVPSR